MNRSYVLQAFAEKPWLILPDKLAALEEIVERHVSGEKLSVEEVQARIQGGDRPLDRRVESVAILPLFGTIFPRSNLMTQMSGATSAEIFGKQFQALINDPEVGAIVLDVNSPGGYSSGIPELSDLVYSARGKKPVVAVANHLMASAAYFVGTSADEVVATPSADVGSVGVYAMHADYSAQLMQAGIKVSFISAGKYKVDGNPYEPLSSTARDTIQASVDNVYADFINAVARNRGVEADAVRSGFGEGRVLNAKAALQAGMVDRIATLDQVVNELLGKVTGKSPSNFPLKAESSALPMTENERKAQSLRTRVEQILQKEK